MGADILNTSLGYTQFDDSTTDHTYADMDGNTTRISIAADIAASKGILVVTSAGNMGSQPWHYISAPADADSSLAVAAVDSFLIRAPFSSYGPSSDGDLKPNVAAMGYKSVCTFSSGVVGQANGTSFSSPILAGMAACLWQSLRGNTNIELKELIERNGHQYSNPDFSLGYGVPNFYTAYLEGNLFPLSTSDEIISVFPSHFNDKLTVHFHSQEPGNWKLNVINSLGQKLYQKELYVAAGEYVQTVFTDELFQLNMGTYLLEFFKDDLKIAVKKVFKIKT
jgi:subtilase family serine protease